MFDILVKFSIFTKPKGDRENLKYKSLQGKKK